jgi:SAM-dependent methyltransferase
MIPPPIDYFNLDHPARMPASKVSYCVRKAIFSFFMETMHPRPDSWILDVGVTPDQTLPDSNMFERLYPFKNRLTITSIEDAAHLQGPYPGVRFVRTEKFELPFRDQSFDIAFCSAVLEHVGEDYQQKHLLREILRVSKRFFIVTPNRLCPIEFHTLLPFIHWLPRTLHQKLLQMIGLDFWARTQNLNLLTPRKVRSMLRPWTRRFRVTNHFFLGFPSNIILYGFSKP